MRWSTLKFDYLFSRNYKKQKTSPEISDRGHAVTTTLHNFY